MKKIFYLMIVSIIGCFMMVGCSKDEVLNIYNDTIQFAGSSLITNEASLKGTKEKGVDDYTGTYQAEYKKFTGTEYLFGGTSIEREAGKEITVTCTLTITSGTAKVFWLSGSDEAKTLLETGETYTETITLPDGGNYFGIECEDFTGSLNLCIQ